jgi:hypothetical protein
MGLSDEVRGLSFVEKLWVVVDKGELDFWEERTRPPNLTADEFRKILDRLDRFKNFHWVPRKSDLGPHGKDGEEVCFKFECDVQFGGIFEIEVKSYFVKGYFFIKGDLRGVTIQSFREIKYEDDR